MSETVSLLLLYATIKEFRHGMHSTTTAENLLLYKSGTQDGWRLHSV